MKKKWKSIAAELVALLVSAIFVVPIWMIFVNSLKDSKHANQLSLSLAGVNLKQAAQNYAEVFRVSGLTTAYLNSTIITVLSVALIVLTASMAAFIIQRRKQKWVGRVNSLIILGMTMPGFTVPTYFLLKSLGLLHTYLGICLVYTASFFPLAVFIFTGYFRSIPDELDESALLDGCTPMQMYWKIILPLIKPVMVTVIIIAGMSIWNEFGTALFLLNSPKRYTVSLTIYSFCSQKKSDWNLLFANITLISLPIIAIYCFLQKYIVSGMTAGAVKDRRYAFKQTNETMDLGGTVSAADILGACRYASHRPRGSGFGQYKRSCPQFNGQRCGLARREQRQRRNFG